MGGKIIQGSSHISVRGQHYRGESRTCRSGDRGAARNGSLTSTGSYASCFQSEGLDPSPRARERREIRARLTGGRIARVTGGWVLRKGRFWPEAGVSGAAATSSGIGGSTDV